MKLEDGCTELVKNAFYDRFNPDEEYLGSNKPVNEIDPLLSVCVPVKEHEGFIDECLDSILSQKTDFPFEIVVGEDGSRDSSRAICKRYADNYPDKIRLFLRDQETSHLYDDDGNFIFRFNVKWLRLSARGRYIALCEGDDYWTNDLKLQKQVDFLNDHPNFSMCFHNARVIYEHKREAHNFVEIEEGEYSGVDTYETRLIPTASVVFKAACIEGNDKQLNSNFFFGDIVLFLMLAECGPYWFFEDVMSVYRKHKGGMMYQVFEKPENVRKFIIHHKQIVKTFPDAYKKTGYKHISWFYFILFRVTFKEDLSESITAFIKSCYYSPTRFFGLLKKFVRVRIRAKRNDDLSSE